MDDIELLLADPENLTPEQKASALAGALKRQRGYGVLGQMMNLEPTKAVGSQMYDQSQTGLKLALDKQQAEREMQTRSMERQVDQERWQRTFNQRQDYQDQRLAQLGRAGAGNTASKSQWRSATDPVTGEMRLYNTITGEWQDRPSQGADQPPPDAALDGNAPMYGFPSLPPGLKQTEVQDKSRFYAQTMAEALPVMASVLEGGYVPARIDQFAAGPQASGVGGKLQSMTPRSFGSEAGKKFYTAGRQVLAAILRKESGAAITDDEWQNYGPMYLPWPGDSPQEVERKANVLYAQANSMAQSSGAAARYWVPPPRPRFNKGRPQAAAPDASVPARDFEAEYGLGDDEEME